MLSKFMVCGLLLHLAGTASTAAEVNVFQDKVFVYRNSDQTIAAAKDWCNGMGGKLPSAHSHSELEAIADRGNGNKPFWLGGYKRPGQKWTWDDGSEWDFDDIGFNSCGRDGTRGCLLYGSRKGSLTKMGAVHEEGDWKFQPVCQLLLQNGTIEQEEMMIKKLDQVMDQLTRVEDEVTGVRNSSDGMNLEVNHKLEVLKIAVFAVPAAIIVFFILVSLVTRPCSTRKQVTRIEPVLSRNKGIENLYCEL